MGEISVIGTPVLKTSVFDAVAGAGPTTSGRSAYIINSQPFEFASGYPSGYDASYTNGAYCGVVIAYSGVGSCTYLSLNTYQKNAGTTGLSLSYGAAYFHG